MPRIKQLYASMHGHPHFDHTTNTKYPQYELPDLGHLPQYTQYAPNHPEYPQYYWDDPLLCTIQMILDSTLLVSKIISINIVSMIKARTNLIYNTLDSTRLTRIMINGTDLDLSIVFIFQQVRDIKFFMVNARLMQTRIFKPNVT